MKRFATYITFLVMAMTAMSASASDPQMFIYRNDGQFNSMRLHSGATLSHVNNNGLSLQLSEGDGNATLIPLSAIDSCVLRVTDIPTLHLTLPEYPDVKDIWSKEDYVDAILTIEGNGYCEDSDNLKLSLRGRGNSTWGMPKKPMRMKFPKKISLFGFKKQKNYVLLANYIDDSLMKNAIAMWMAQRLGVPYTNHIVPVNVEINGYPRGSYMITEKVGINSGSVDIDETKGILFELDGTFDEPYKFISDLWGLPVMVKDPDFKELCEENPDGQTPEQMLEMWKEDFNEALRQLKNHNGSAAFDMDSFARGLLMNNICLNHEISHPKSFYIHKQALGQEALYTFGPVWDFDVTFDFHKPMNDGTFQPRPAQTPFALSDFLLHFTVDPEFMKIYKPLLKKFADEDLPDLLVFIKEYAALIEPSAMNDAVVWPESYHLDWFERAPSTNVKKRAEELCEWITERVQYLLERAENNKF